jgi:hypothetical protein
MKDRLTCKILHGQKCLAGAVGIEPTNHGTKTRCLTTWLRPITLGFVSDEFYRILSVRSILLRKLEFGHDIFAGPHVL